MGDAVRTAAQHKIFRFTTSARAAGWEMMSKRISLRYAQGVTGPEIFIAKHHKMNRQSDRTTKAEIKTRGQRESWGTYPQDRPTRLATERLNNADLHRRLDGSPLS